LVQACAILFAIAAAAIITSQRLESAPRVLCADAELAEKLRKELRAALDDALREQVKHVFLTWLKDDSGQPDRARTGVRQALSAYVGAIEALQRFHPPPCDLPR
jgi:hypothetical protein